MAFGDRFLAWFGRRLEDVFETLLEVGQNLGEALEPEERATNRAARAARRAARRTPAARREVTAKRTRRRATEREAKGKKPKRQRKPRVRAPGAPPPPPPPLPVEPRADYELVYPGNDQWVATEFERARFTSQARAEQSYRDLVRAIGSPEMVTFAHWFAGRAPWRIYVGRS